MTSTTTTDPTGKKLAETFEDWLCEHEEASDACDILGVVV